MRPWLNGRDACVFPPPCGEGQRVGVVDVGRFLSCTTPTSYSSPQGGGERPASRSTVPCPAPNRQTGAAPDIRGPPCPSKCPAPPMPTCSGRPPATRCGSPTPT